MCWGYIVVELGVIGGKDCWGVIDVDLLVECVLYGYWVGVVFGWYWFVGFGGS